MVRQDHRLQLPLDGVAVVPREHVYLPLVHTELADVRLEVEHVAALCFGRGGRRGGVQSAECRVQVGGREDGRERKRRSNARLTTRRQEWIKVGKGTSERGERVRVRVSVCPCVCPSVRVSVRRVRM